MKHEHETAQPAPLGQVERGVRRLYVYDAKGHHVRLYCDGDAIHADAVFNGRACSFTTDLAGAVLLKKACCALLNDAGA